MAQDLTFAIPAGIVNIRVGAIIRKGKRFLMVENVRDGFLYSVGGRIHFGESTEEAVRREVKEETGRELAIDRLRFTYESFYEDSFGETKGKLFHEFCFYYEMKVSDDFEPVDDVIRDEPREERLLWVDETTEKILYPAFFRTELGKPFLEVRHIVEDYRKKAENP